MIEVFGVPDRLLFAIWKQRWARDADPGTALCVLARQVDPVEFKHYLIEHGVLGIVLRFHTELVQSLWGTRVTSQFQIAYAAAALRTTSLRATTLELARLLSGAGVRWVLLKGVGLSLQIYGDASIRSAGDIDVLVDPEHLPAAIEALESGGFAAAKDERKAVMTAPGRLARHHLVFRSASDVVVELHWRSDFSPQLSLPPLSSLREGLGDIILDGMGLPCLQRELLATYVARHAFRSLWVRWKWLYDVLQCVEQCAAHGTQQLAIVRREPCVAATLALAGRLMQLEHGYFASSLPLKPRLRPENALVMRDLEIRRFQFETGVAGRRQSLYRLVQHAVFQSCAIQRRSARYGYLAWRIVRMLIDTRRSSVH